MLNWLKKRMRPEGQALKIVSEQALSDVNDPYSGEVAEAEALHDNQKWLAADEIYGAILAKDPQHPKALFGRAQLLADAGHYDLAADYVTRSLESASPFRSVRSINLLAMIELERGRHDIALALADEVLEQDPQNAQALVIQGNVHRHAGRESSAMSSFEKALKADPAHINGLFAFAKLHQGGGRYAAAAALYKRLHLLVPAHASICGDLALCLIHSGDKAAGIQKMREAVKLDPNNVDAWATLVQALVSSNQIEGALKVLEEVHPMGFTDIRLLQALGDFRGLTQDYAGSIEAYESGLVLAKTDEERLHMLMAIGAAWHNLGDQTRALTYFDQAEGLCTGVNEKYLPVLRYNRSELRLIQGDLANGFKDYACRFQAVDFLRRAPVLDKSRWDGRTDLNNRSVLVWMEQGIGDEIQFSRYASELKRRYPKSRVIFGARPSTYRLMKQLSGVDKVVVLGKDPDPETDFHVPVMSLPGLLDESVETIDPSPYLFVDESLRAQWAKRMGPSTGRLRVGIVWAGSPMVDRPSENARDRIRSLALSAIKPILDVVDVDFYSLQIYPPAKDAAQSLSARPRLPAHVIDLTRDVTDFADTAALISHLDLVIGVDTSTVHCAGAIGCPVWLLNRKNTCWRWFKEGDRSPWYQNFRIFRQKNLGEWGPVIDRAASALIDLAQARKNRAAA